MANSQAKYPAGSRVKIATLDELARFQADWKQHHPLEPEQLEHAEVVTMVKEVTYYRDGDPLYVLEGVPGVWHEPCLAAA